MDAWLQSQGWDETIWLVIVPVGLILVMVVAGIFANTLGR